MPAEVILVPCGGVQGDDAPVGVEQVADAVAADVRSELSIELSVLQKDFRCP